VESRQLEFTILHVAERPSLRLYLYTPPTEAEPRLRCERRSLPVEINRNTQRAKF